MLARCARCQGTFSTERYGRQTCPHCGAELILPPPPGTPTEPEATPPQSAAQKVSLSLMEKEGPRHVVLDGLEL